MHRGITKADCIKKKKKNTHSLQNISTTRMHGSRKIHLLADSAGVYE